MTGVISLTKESLEQVLSDKRAELIEFNKHPDLDMATLRSFLRGKLEGQIDLLLELIRTLSE